MPLLTVEICARPPHTAFLVVSYNGKTPPADLFADLEMLGWKPPAVAPPPKIAIDWDTPDEATGARYTVRDYLVEGAVVEPPAGSGPRGSWARGERTLLLAPLDRVLTRHQVHVIDRIGGLERRESAPTLPPPPAPIASTPPVAVAPAPVPEPVATGTRMVNIDNGLGLNTQGFMNGDDPYGMTAQEYFGKHHSRVTQTMENGVAALGNDRDKVRAAVQEFADATAKLEETNTLSRIVGNTADYFDDSGDPKGHSAVANRYMLDWTEEALFRGNDIRTHVDELTDQIMKKYGRP